jgi:hypothetical protein
MAKRSDPSDRRTAREIERDAVREPSLLPGALPAEARQSEPLAMLIRRGFTPGRCALDLPFDPDLPEADAARLAEHLEHYAFRLFLRGAILRPDGFTPAEATRFLALDRAAETAEQLVALGLSEPIGEGRYRLRRPAASFGGTLEWFVARQLRVRYALEAVAGVQFRATGVGGDLDVVASAEGKLVALELKSSPPKHLGEDEIAAFFDRIQALRPDVAIFAMDTALRLSDKVIPLLEREVTARRGKKTSARRVDREMWAITPHVYAVNAKPNLMGNIGRALAEGLRALAPRAI